MGSELSQPVVIGVVIMTILVIVQTLFTTFLLTSTLRGLGSLCQELTRTSQRFRQAVRQADDGLEDMIPVLKMVSSWAREASGHSDSVRDSVREIEEKTARSLDTLRAGAQEAASQMNRALNRISTETYRIHRSIMVPTQQISALIQAGRSIVERWFGRDGRPADDYTTDEDIFI